MVDITIAHPVYKIISYIPVLLLYLKILYKNPLKMGNQPTNQFNPNNNK